MKMWLAGVLLWCLAAVTLFASDSVCRAGGGGQQLYQYTIVTLCVDVNNNRVQGQTVSYDCYKANPDGSLGALLNNNPIVDQSDGNGFAAASIVTPDYNGPVVWIAVTTPTMLGVLSATPSTATMLSGNEGFITGSIPEGVTEYVKIQCRPGGGGGIGG